MRISRPIGFFLITASVLGVIYCIAGVGDPSFWFRHKSARYHAEFAKACDSIRSAPRSYGTNKFIEVPTNDASLPKIIRDLPPFKIKLGPNWVWIQAGGTGHATGCGITWEGGVLTTASESGPKVVYVAKQ